LTGGECSGRPLDLKPRGGGHLRPTLRSARPGGGSARAVAAAAPRRSPRAHLAAEFEWVSRAVCAESARVCWCWWRCREVDGPLAMVCALLLGVPSGGCGGGGSYCCSPQPTHRGCRVDSDKVFGSRVGANRAVSMASGGDVSAQTECCHVPPRSNDRCRAQPTIDIFVQHA
jgi:hypothetical protein